MNTAEGRLDHVVDVDDAFEYAILVSSRLSSSIAANNWVPSVVDDFSRRLPPLLYNFLVTDRDIYKHRKLAVETAALHWMGQLEILGKKLEKIALRDQRQQAIKKYFPHSMVPEQFIKLCENRVRDITLQYSRIFPAPLSNPSPKRP